MLDAIYDGCIIHYSVNNSESCPCEEASDFMKFTGVSEIVMIHDLNVTDSTIPNAAVNAIMTFCKGMGSKIVAYEFGAGVFEDAEKLRKKYVANSVEKYRDLCVAKNQAAIMEFVGFLPVSFCSSDDNREIYVMSNKEGIDFKAKLELYAAGVTILSNAACDVSELQVITTSYEGEDKRLGTTIKALFNAMSDKGKESLLSELQNGVVKKARAF